MRTAVAEGKRRGFGGIEPDDITVRRRFDEITRGSDPKPVSDVGGEATTRDPNSEALLNQVFDHRPGGKPRPKRDPGSEISPWISLDARMAAIDAKIGAVARELVGSRLTVEDAGYELSLVACEMTGLFPPPEAEARPPEPALASA